MSETVVLDASVGVRIAVEDQEGHEEAARCLESVYAAGRRVIVPDLYLYEIGNALSRGRHGADRKVRLLLAAYETVEVAHPSPEALTRAMEISADGKPSFYDAAYVALAEEVDGTLWTEDKELLKRYAGRTASTEELLRRLR